ncbi:MAG TPA: NADH-quinone oxidoreductase subunit N, partial [Mycobacterium sp.]|nr:NADH-quinone oxidoreductase subunit N [Mycobacterium sp.]
MIASLATLHADTVTSFGAPSFEYKVLAPILIVLVAAVISVLVEAVAPREVRWIVQVILTIGALAAAFIMVVALAGTRTTAAVGAVVIDGPALVIQGTLLAMAIVAMLTFAERQIDHGLDAFAPAASALPGSADERTLTKMGALQTEVYPLALFSITGMLLFPASNDLLTMFVALEVLSLPL